MESVHNAKKMHFNAVNAEISTMSIWTDFCVMNADFAALHSCRSPFLLVLPLQWLPFITKNNVVMPLIESFVFMLKIFWLQNWDFCGKFAEITKLWLGCDWRHFFSSGRNRLLVVFRACFARPINPNLSRSSRIYHLRYIRCLLIYFQVTYRSVCSNYSIVVAVRRELLRYMKRLRHPIKSLSNGITRFSASTVSCFVCLKAFVQLSAQILQVRFAPYWDSKENIFILFLF
jgi:hypothetical protein